MAETIEQMLLRMDRQTAIGPMDTACQYMRKRFFPLLSGYLLAMLPYTLIMLMLIDAVSSEYRAGVKEGCLYLTIATFWRWTGQAMIQRDILRDCGLYSGQSIGKRLPAYFVARLAGNFMVTWIAIAIIPFYYGMYLSGMVAPALLQSKDDSWTCIKRLFSTTGKNFDRLWKVLGMLKLFILVLFVFILGIQALLLSQLLPSLFGVNTDDAMITFGGIHWLISLGYILFMLVDFYWMVLCPILFEALQARRRGFDLMRRIELLEQTA